MKQQPDGSYMPDFSNRYLTQDLPYGLLVQKGVAELCGVPTPNTSHTTTRRGGRTRMTASTRSRSGALRSTCTPSLIWCGALVAAGESRAAAPTPW